MLFGLFQSSAEYFWTAFYEKIVKKEKILNEKGQRNLIKGKNLIIIGISTNEHRNFMWFYWFKIRQSKLLFIKCSKVIKWNCSLQEHFKVVN